MLKFTQSLRKNITGLNSFLRFTSSTTASPPLEAVSKEVTSREEKINITQKNLKYANQMVAAAFASLQDDALLSTVESTEAKTPFTDRRITEAKTVNDLLSISEGSGVSRKHALKVVSILAEWSSSGRISLNDFEKDQRFIKLCKTLTRIPGKRDSRASFPGDSRRTLRSDDLSTVLAVTADEEAAKLIEDLTLGQMVAVMRTLAAKKRRSTQLLRTISFNIAKSQEVLDLKQSADLLYSTAVLNYLDENLHEKVCADLCKSVPGHKTKSAIIGSISTSLGVLKYKNTEVLDVLSAWFLGNYESSRPQDVFSFVLSLGVLNYEPENSERFFQVVIPSLSQADAQSPAEWLEFVWSLAVLNRASESLISSVLSEEFVRVASGEEAKGSTYLKMLNLDGAASCVANYSGPRLSEEFKKGVSLSRGKSKEDLVHSVVDTVKSLLPSEKYFETNINTHFGFFVGSFSSISSKHLQSLSYFYCTFDYDFLFLDVCCLLDNKGNAVPLSTTSNDYQR